MPFAGYASMEECVKRNADKGDPAAYCATIMRGVEKAEADNRSTVSVLKLDPARQLVFGWASVAISKDGQVVVDRQGDIIPPQELEDAAYEYVLEYRVANEGHTEMTRGHLVESMVFTPEKLEKMGLPAHGAPTGWWVGFKLDADTFAKVQSGELAMFSIEGEAVQVAA